MNTVKAWREECSYSYTLFCALAAGPRGSEVAVEHTTRAFNMFEVVWYLLRCGEAAWSLDGSASVSSPPRLRCRRYNHLWPEGGKAVVEVLSSLICLATLDLS
jgi:hypothetical protein